MSFNPAANSSKNPLKRSAESDEHPALKKVELEKPGSSSPKAKEVIPYNQVITKPGHLYSGTLFHHYLIELSSSPSIGDHRSEVKEMLRKGADLFVKDRLGISPLGYLVYNPYLSSILFSLIKADLIKYPSLLLPIPDGKLYERYYILNVDPYTSKIGHTPLHSSRASRSLTQAPLYNLLLDFRSDPDLFSHEISILAMACSDLFTSPEPKEPVHLPLELVPVIKDAAHELSEESTEEFKEEIKFLTTPTEYGHPDLHNLFQLLLLLQSYPAVVKSFIQYLAQAVISERGRLAKIEEDKKI